MATVPQTEAQLTLEARAFAERIDGARDRWEYCLAASHYQFITQRGDTVLCLNPKSVPGCVKLLGRRKFWVEYGLKRLRKDGFEVAQRDDAERVANFPDSLRRPIFEVGPLPAWSIGHVYFARVRDFPHVVKIGFSRRVHDRLADIEASHGAVLEVRERQLLVGTMLNEQWWHRNWANFNIVGEWFFDPHMTDRTLPGFLHQQREAA